MAGETRRGRRILLECKGLIRDFRAGAYLHKGRVDRLIVLLTILWQLLPVGMLAFSQEQAPVTSSAPIPSATQSSCFGHALTKIGFPDVSEQDQKWLADLAQMHEGDTLTRSGLQQALRKLYANGRFADLKAECEQSSNGSVTLTFENRPNYFIGTVTVQGGPQRPSDAQIVNASRLELGQLFTTDKLTAAINNIQHIMQENGYYQAAIMHSEQTNSATQQIAIAFTIHPGEQAHVGDIAVQGSAIYSRGQIEDIGHIHTGDLITAQTTSSAIEKLRKAYQKKKHWLAQVQIASTKYQPQRNVVDYTIQIDAGPLVQIEVEGVRMSEGTIRKNVPVYEEGALDEDLLNEGRRNLLSYMESRGYFEATVALKRESDPKQNLTRVIYQIDPGERHKVVKIEITGNKMFSTESLRSSMQVQEASLLLSHGRYSEALLRSDVRTIENQYKANGFADVKVDPKVIDDYRGVHNQIAVVIQITEGPQSRVGSFQIVGMNTLKLPPCPTFCLNTESGQDFSDVNIAQDRDLLLNYYFDNGYPNATFEATAKADGDHLMDVIFHIDEGERVFVDQVLVTGREFTRPYVIDRELQVKAGDPLSQTSMLETQQKLYDLGIFSQVDTAVQNPDGAAEHKNVLVQVREAKRYTFNYGGGFEFQTGQPSTHEPLGAVTPLVSFDMTRLNFRGRDHTITFESRVGGLQQRGLISYEAPNWFSNPNLKLTFTAFFDHTLDVQTFTSQRLEGTVQANQVINKFSTIDYRFNYRLVKALNVNINPEEIPLLSLPVRLGEPGFGYIRNRRDNDLETTRGSYLTVDGGVASSYFGSQADFSRLLVQQATYHPFGKKQGAGKGLVFARSTRVGVESPFGNTVVVQPGEITSSTPTLIPLPERFLMGGGNSHRGFGLNQAGPRDPVTGDPLGGSALFLNNLELRFPPPTLPFVGENMSFAIFEDMGNVFTDSNHMLNSLLRWHQDKSLCSQPSNGEGSASSQPALRCQYNYINHAIGIGVRYKTPVGPVRFDFGYDLNPTVYPTFNAGPNSTQQAPTFVYTGTHQATPFNIYFSIGQTF